MILGDKMFLLIVIAICWCALILDAALIIPWKDGLAALVIIPATLLAFIAFYNVMMR